MGGLDVRDAAERFIEISSRRILMNPTDPEYVIAFRDEVLARDDLRVALDDRDENATETP